LRAAGHVATAVLTTVVVLLVLAVAVGKTLGHLGLSPVLTGSMRPAYSPGDAVLTQRVPVTSLRPGMIAVFVPPGEQAAFAHRIVSISGDPRRPVVVTKGDANPAADPWRATLSTPTVPRVVTVLPKIGYPLVWVRDPRWRSALVGLLGLLGTALLTRSILRPRPRLVARHARLSPAQ
jgi:signal peptidase I